MYNFEVDDGSSYLYRIEGETVVINQHNLGNTIFMRVEQEGLSEDSLNKLKKTISEGAGNINVVFLPPWIKVLRVSNVVQYTPQGKARACQRCGGIMRQHGTGFICYQCGNEVVGNVAGGAPLNIGEMP